MATHFEIPCLKARASTAENHQSLTEELTLSDSPETGRVSLTMEDGSVLTDGARRQNKVVL